MTDVGTLDFETYYDQDYSLRKMTTQQYILDPLFEVIGVSYTVNDNPVEFIDGRNKHKLKSKLAQLVNDVPIWSAHNCFFDMGILALRYRLHPKMMLDTRMMANALDRPYLRSVGLASLAEYHGYPSKGSTVVDMKGRRLASLSEQELYAYGEYCKHDTWLCRHLTKRYLKMLPNEELKSIHRVLELFTHPTLEINPAPLDDAIEEEEEKQARVLSEIGGFTKADVNSNPKLAAALTMLGVDPPTKMSLRTHKHTWAFSKKDLNFLALREHESPEVRALVEARLTVKSNIVQTRAKRFKSLSVLGPLCAPFVYYAAHTGRLGGTDSLNLQNLPRGSKLREALCAPEGYKIVAGDLSQIEARLTAWFCSEFDILEAYRNQEDLYCRLASQIFRTPITKERHPAERFVGKVGELSLQYGAGDRTFELMLRTSGQPLPSLNVSRLATETVNIYRHSHPQTRKMWRILSNIITQTMVAPSASEREIKGCRFGFEKVELPGGMQLTYNDLAERTVQVVKNNENHLETQLTYFHGGAQKKLYGPKLLENIIQALARLILRDHWLHLAQTYRIVLQVHDELVAVVKDEHVDRAVQDFVRRLSQPVSWCPDLPVACEVSVGQNYREAK